MPFTAPREHLWLLWHRSKAVVSFQEDWRAISRKTGSNEVTFHQEFSKRPLIKSGECLIVNNLYLN